MTNIIDRVYSIKKLINITYYIIGDVRTKKGYIYIIITSAGKLSPALHYTLSQSIGRGRISHVGSLVVFRIVVRESRDCGVIKFPQKDPTILAWYCYGTGSFLKMQFALLAAKLQFWPRKRQLLCVWGGGDINSKLAGQ